MIINFFDGVHQIFVACIFVIILSIVVVFIDKVVRVPISKLVDKIIK